MHEDDHSVNRAFESLRSARWTGESHQDDLEEKLMREFHNRKHTSVLSRHRGLVAALAVILVGGVGFGATLAPQTVKRWFVKLTLIGPGGGEVEGMVLEAVDDDGDGAVTMTFGSVDDDVTTITLQEVGAGEERVPPADATMDITISKVQVGGDTADAESEVQTSITIAEAGSVPETMLQQMRIMDRSAMIDQIEALEPVDSWEDEAGNLRELHVLENVGDASGLLISDSYVDAEGERSMHIVGSLMGIAPETVELVDLLWDDEGAATLIFETEDGQSRIVIVEPWTPGAEALAPTQMRIEMGAEVVPEGR